MLMCAVFKRGIRERLLADGRTKRQVGQLMTRLLQEWDKMEREWDNMEKRKATRQFFRDPPPELAVCKYLFRKGGYWTQAALEVAVLVVEGFETKDKERAIAKGKW